MSRSTPPPAADLAAFVRSLEDDLLLPTLWLIRRSALGAILELYEPAEQTLEIVDDRLFTQNRGLYDLVQERMEEN